MRGETHAQIRGLLTQLGSDSTSKELSELSGLSTLEVGTTLYSLTKLGFTVKLARGRHELTLRGLMARGFLGKCEICNTSRAGRVYTFLSSDPTTSRRVCEACWKRLSASMM